MPAACNQHYMLRTSTSWCNKCFASNTHAYGYTDCKVRGTTRAHANFVLGDMHLMSWPRPSTKHMTQTCTIERQPPMHTPWVCLGKVHFEQRYKLYNLPARGPNNSSNCSSQQLLMCAGVDCGLCHMASNIRLVTAAPKVKGLCC